MKNILLSIMSIVVLVTSDFSAASAFDFIASPKPQRNTLQTDENIQLAQRGSWGRRNNFNRNFQRQQHQRRMQQQRMRQQRLQRQRMEQRRKQQAQQRRRQMEAARARQRQAALQRQQAIQQRRLTQTRQRQEAQRKRGQQTRSAKNKALQTQRLAKKQIQDRQRLRRLKQLRERDQKLKLQKQKQKQNDVAALAALKTAKTVSSLKTTAFTKKIETTRSNLQKIKAQQLKLNKKETKDLNKNAQKVAKIAALRSKIKCTTPSCGCSFHGSTLVKTLRGMVAIKDIRAGVDFAWSKNEYTGEQDWKQVTDHFVNTYEHRVVVSAKSADGNIQEIISNRVHPFFVQIPNADLQRHLVSSANSVSPISSEGHYYTGNISSGYWIDAANLKRGYRLLNADTSWSEVISVNHETKQLKAYNLTVEGFHTFFVAANDNSPSVWVHNDCNYRQAKQRLKDAKKQAAKTSVANKSLPEIRKVGNLNGGPLENASKVSGRFKLEKGPPNGTVYRSDNKGNITSYATYDKSGRILKRVDVSGAAHNGVKTPHVIEYGRNKLPNGNIRVHTPSGDPRPAKIDELP